MEEAVDAECGSDAADHQLEIEKSYLRPRAEAIDCDLGTNLLTDCKGGWGVAPCVSIWGPILSSISCVARGIMDSN